jgi:hypothetical protein
MIIGTVQFVVSYQFNNISVVYIFLNDDYKLKHFNIEKIIVDHRVKVSTAKLFFNITGINRFFFKCLTGLLMYFFFNFDSIILVILPI